jgi:hypothetical protein
VEGGGPEYGVGGAPLQNPVDEIGGRHGGPDSTGRGGPCPLSISGPDRPESAADPVCGDSRGDAPIASLQKSSPGSVHRTAVPFRFASGASP